MGAMPESAIVIPIGAKIASNMTVWCLEPVGGEASLSLLLKRLQRGLGTAEFEYHVLLQDQVILPRVEAALRGLPVKVHATGARNRLQALASLYKEAPALKTLLVFHENALFPACKRLRAMLQYHRGQRADG